MYDAIFPEISIIICVITMQIANLINLSNVKGLVPKYDKTNASP